MDASSTPEGAGPVGRLAPSPTGWLHVGHARTFLLAWWHARSRGGRIVLRVEDLDAGRVKPGMVDACLEDLEWLGLDWDGAWELQSRSTAHLEAALARLELRGLVYPCVCSRRDIAAALSAPHEDDGERPYPGTCRDRWASAADAEREAGVAAGLRFRTRQGVLALADAFAGPFASEPAAECGDFLVARRDGAFGYHLAVVVDDARAGVTEVLRGDDLLGSCGRQRLLQEALDLPCPTWIHVPLVLDERGRRLAKRHDALALRALRESGVDPRSLVAWIARSAGQEAPEPLAPADLLPAFDLERLPREPVVFGPDQQAPLVRRGPR